MRHGSTSVRACSAAVAALVLGCGREPAADPQALMQAARADSVAEAEQLYDPTVFDTLSFYRDPTARLARGDVVWRTSCQKCHGADFRGLGDFAVRNAIEVPSLLDEDWVRRGELEPLRHRIFIGHPSAMPNWGLVGLKYRDVDAVVAFIIDQIGPAETKPR